jgi:hypothetical protein
VAVTTRLYLPGFLTTGLTDIETGWQPNPLNPPFASFGSGARSAGGTNADLWFDQPANDRAVVDNSVSRQNQLHSQTIWRHLAAQTLSGTWKGQMLAMESDVAADMHLTCGLWVMNGADGSSRGTLFTSANNASTGVGGAGTDTYELVASTLTNRKVPPGWSGAGSALTNVTAHDGDLLVLDLGIRATNTVSTAYTGTTRYYYGTLAADLPEDETSTDTTKNPWIEFSMNIAWKAPVMVAGGDFGGGVGAVVLTAGQLWPRGAGT